MMQTIRAWPSRTGMQVSEPIVLVVTTFMLFITIIFYGLSSADDSDKYGFELNLDEIYRHDNNDTIHGYALQISPPMWGYTVIIIIAFIWQFVWLSYGWTFMFRPRVPKVIPLAAYLLFSIAMGLIIIRLYLYANRDIHPGLTCQILVTAVLILALVLMHFVMYHRTYQLQQEGWLVDKWLTRMLVHNGLAFLITWEVIELLLDINVSMQYTTEKKVRGDVASSIVVAAYFVIITMWLILETTILDQFMRYTISIYPVCIWYLMTAVIEQWNHKRFRQPRNNNFLVAALSYTVTIQICRMLFLVFFHIFRPLDWPQPRPSTIGYRRVHLQY